MHLYRRELVNYISFDSQLIFMHYLFILEDQKRMTIITIWIVTRVIKMQMWMMQKRKVLMKMGKMMKQPQWKMTPKMRITESKSLKIQKKIVLGWSMVT